jgi:hypothetical protein
MEIRLLQCLFVAVLLTGCLKNDGTTDRQSCATGLISSKFATISFDANTIIDKKWKIFSGSNLVLDECSPAQGPNATPPAYPYLIDRDLSQKTGMIIEYIWGTPPSSETVSLSVRDHCSSPDTLIGNANVIFDFKEIYHPECGNTTTESKTAVGFH